MVTVEENTLERELKLSSCAQFLSDLEPKAVVRTSLALSLIMQMPRT